MYIGGEPVRTPDSIAVRLPYDGSEVGTIFAATAENVDAAVEAASKASAVMKEMTRHERAAILRRAQQKLLGMREEMAKAIASECGKPIKEAQTEIDRSALTLGFSADEANRLGGEVIPMDASPGGKGHFAVTVREPLGVIAAITPFNFPLNLAMHKIGPAIAGGNAVVHKPASSTPLSALKMARIFEECGLPKGALNVITGPGGAVGEALVFHKDVAMITFTGSPEVGLRLRNLAGLKRVTLELGNNSAVIVDEDANVDEAASRCVAGSFAHSGQVCISVQRIFCHSKISNRFVERFVEGAKKLKLGHPMEPDTDISSLITEHEAERVESWVQEAVAAGAKLVEGGKRQRATLSPTVLTDVPPQTQIFRREAFGPVVGINSYDSLDDAIDRVNASDYGLQAGIYTQDLTKAFQAARRIHVGGFMINEIPQYRVDQMPYGGVKLSGTGREGPHYAIEEMTEMKLICWKM